MEGSDAPHLRRFRAGISAACGGSGALVFGSFRLDGSRRVLTAHGQEVTLQPRAFDLLELFVACRGQVLSADEIVGHVWRGVAVGENNLGVQLSALRRALAAHGGQGLIVTLPGRGYRFVGEVTEETKADRQATDPPEGGARAVRLPQAAAPAPRWRVTAIAAIAMSAALAGSVVAWRATAPVDTPQAVAAREAFNPPPHSIAVLAFTNLSRDPGADYLSDGLSEALVDVLSRVDQLQVTARTSSFAFKGKAATVGEIARKLNVRSVLEGSLRRQGTHLRIDAHLSDARTGFQIWSQSYDRNLDDMLKLQDDIAGDVAEALQAKLLDRDASGRTLGGTTNPQAFDAYLRAEQLVEIDDKNVDTLYHQNEAAISEFRKATELDPDFALALTGLSLALVWKAGYAMSTADPAYGRVLDEAQRAAEHAAAVAPGLGLPHAALGGLRLEGLTDFSAAWDEAIRARALTPGDATVQEAFAEIASNVGRRQAAVKAAMRAVTLDPLHAEAWFTSMRVLLCAHQFDASRAAFQRGIEVLGHAPSFAPFKFGSLSIMQGKPEAARQICLTSHAWTDMCLAIADHALGRQEEAATHALEMYEQAGDDNSYNLAAVYAQWHQPALAMYWLAKARQINDPGLAEMDCDPFLDPIRGQPGFRDIEQTLHLPPPE
jgi:TolB-like protein/DNA-binding winged helix-turn-helix (wHTH) protein/Flp pilus assembly protein TadD